MTHQPRPRRTDVDTPDVDTPDVLARLARTDPVAAGFDLDPALLRRMALALTTEPSEPAAPVPPSPRRRRRSRRLVAAAAAVLVLGGGVAYASYETWYAGGASDGLTCVTSWSGNREALLENSTGGPELTGDPVADCQRYQQLSGLEPIEDPVAFRFPDSDLGTLVAPAQDVPEGAVVLAGPAADDVAARELEASLRDHVDGGLSRCFSGDEARAFAVAELARLDLQGWTVDTAAAEPSAGPCAVDSAVDATSRTVTVFPERTGDPSDPGRVDAAASSVFVLRDALREVVAQCLPLAEATDRAELALGTGHHWPLTAVPDPAATCTRIDLEVGGSIQVTLHGPGEP